MEQYRSIMAVIAMLVAMGIVGQLTRIEASPVSRPYQTCVKEVADYLALKSIPSPVLRLVEKTRKYYPDFTVLFGGEPIKTNYVRAMEKLGPQDGCMDLIRYVNDISRAVPCYKKLEVRILDVAQSTNQAARDVIEADYSCQMSM